MCIKATESPPPDTATPMAGISTALQDWLTSFQDANPLLLGIVLLLTAGHMLKPEGTDEHDADNIVSRIAKKLFNASDEYDGDKLFTRIDGSDAPSLADILSS